MESKVILSTAKEQLKSVGLNNKLRVIKSDFFLVKMFDFIKTKKTSNSREIDWRFIRSNHNR